VAVDTVQALAIRAAMVLQQTVMAAVALVMAHQRQEAQVIVLVLQVGQDFIKALPTEQVAGAAARAQLVRQVLFLEQPP
jgi:hypothetical protein